MKKIFLTMTATASVLIFIGSLFLNTVLGTFGLVTTSAKELSQLRESQQIVEKMKAVVVY
ncbi:hypothetical protein GCM10025856_13360 [Methylophaga marina]|uniref:Methyl-accepting chemotaxis protein n=1 Tax=Methylophaga marina TaxID=45495 RepID=A0ABP3DFR7_9GAMM|nr:hypothetical protein [Methylophaga marina]BDZ73617.1 hypothetical protein GCM10025856_13360 [Methylophaga marina]